MTLMKNQRIKGIILVLTAGILWGVCGTVAQYLFHITGFTPEWVVVIRLLVAGMILLLISAIKGEHKLSAIWKDRKDIKSLLLFSILGLVAVQYTFFMAINYSNAATATVLQYLTPVIITCYFTLISKRLPSKKEILVVGLAVLGTFMIATKGNIHHLSISVQALLWGIGSAFALAFYTLLPRKLLPKWGSSLVLGWAMLIGGICFSFYSPPWEFTGEWSFYAICAVLFIIIFGTVVPFICYLESMKYIRATEVSVLASIEPVAAAFVSILWLEVTFGIAEWIGTICIISTVLILAIFDKPAKQKRSKPVFSSKESA